MIGIIDYGMGNLRSVRNALDAQAIEAHIVDTPAAIRSAQRLIVPGVGAFAHAMRELHQRALVQPIRDAAAAGTPILGICLGMQLFVSEGTESEHTSGLDLIGGVCSRLRVTAPQRLPHVGWNAISLRRPHPVFEGVRTATDYYFVHSFAVTTTHDEDVLAETEYGTRFTSVIARGSVIGTQFHPEKSQTSGLRILENFANWDGTC